MTKLVLKFIKIRGVVSHLDIQNPFNKVGLTHAWVDFMLGLTMCLIEEHKTFAELSNQAVYPADLERFCDNNNISCVIEDEQPSLSDGLSKKAAREFAIANCRLAGLSITPEILAAVDLTTKGHITTKEAIGQLLKNE